MSETLEKSQLSEFFDVSSGVIVIFVLLKYENELELVTSDISFNSVRPWQI